MPAEHFSFRHPEVQPRELFAHTIDTQIYFCNLVKAGPIRSREDLEKTVTDKAGVVQMVKDGSLLWRRCGLPTRRSTMMTSAPPNSSRCGISDLSSCTATSTTAIS